MRYFVYCRKSTESEERQALSIESQRSEIQRFLGTAADSTIVEVLIESKSAKSPGRPIFNQMIERIRGGEADGIVAWHPDRLARNSVDGGLIIYLLDQHIIKDMKFANFSFENTSQGKFMLQIMFGYSKYYVDNLSENIKRGNRAKIAKGWRPNSAPLGYLNDRDTRTIILDPDRAPLVRKLFERAQLGNTSLRQLQRDTQRWGLTTRPKLRRGSRVLAISTIHRILTNPFYAGMLPWGGAMYKGAHEPIVTKEEFARTQKFLKRHGKSAYIKKEFPFTGIIRCGHCGMGVTAETHINPYGSRYTYYRCTRKSREIKCNQPFVRSEKIANEIITRLYNVHIPDRIYGALITELENQSSALSADELQHLQKVTANIDLAKRALANVVQLRAKEFITEEEFLAQRQIIQKEISIAEDEAEKVQKTTSRLELIRTYLEFRNRAVLYLQHGSARIQRSVAAIVGSNYQLLDKKLRFTAKKPFVLTAFGIDCSDLRRVVNEVRTFAAEHSAEFNDTIAEIQKLNLLLQNHSITHGQQFN